MEISVMRRHFYLLMALAALASASIPASDMENYVDSLRERRSLKVAAKIPIIKKIPVVAKAHLAKIPVIGSLFGLHATPAIPHLGTYPIWKVHRYHGISLQPVPYPAERIPSTLPHPPILPGEAPSIVNVPDPNYAPLDGPVPPANEYGVPPSGYSSASYSSASASASASSAPDSPSPVYSAPYASRDPRGPVSTDHAGASDYSISASSYSGFDHSGGIGGDLDLSTLQTILPPELFNKVQLYASTPEGYARVSALLGIANNARKLKFNAAQSIQGMFQKLFGGAGGSTNVALNSGTWTNVPAVYPAPQGIFNNLKPVGTGISGSLLPSLPDVPDLPDIPGLQTLPPAPQLPHINLPEITPLSSNGLGGSYVSIQFPKSPQIEETHPHSAAYASAQQYSPPSQQYSPPPQQYGPPAQQYGPPSQQYGPPPQQSDPPAQQYGPPSQQYGPPPQQSDPPAQQYGPPSQQYGPPPQQYGPPAEQYSVPEIPSTSYGTPVGPVYSYPQSSGSSSSSFFQAPQQTYGTPDASFAASEAEGQYEGRNSESQEKEQAEPAESENNQTQVPLKTTKLHRIQGSQQLRGEALKAFFDSRRAFRPSLQEQKKQSENEVNEDHQS